MFVQLSAFGVDMAAFVSPISQMTIYFSKELDVFFNPTIKCIPE